MNSSKKTKDNSILEAAAREYLEAGSNEAKEALVQAGEALVTYYAALYSPGKIDEDLKQAGYEGLLKAIRRYNPQHGTMFSTYAVHCIIGEIRHELRNRGLFKVPEVVKKIQAKVINATEELFQNNAAMPTLQEIARKVNVTEEGIVEAMQAGCVSLEEVDLSKVKHLHYESFKLPIEDKITLEMSIEKIDNLQKRIIYLIYYEGLTQEETANKLGLNQRKVSRLLKNGLSEIRLGMS